MLAKPGATLCGNHARDGDDGARVECEHCKTRVANLAKHLRRCPARLHKVEQASQPYFALDVNTGEDDPEDPRAHTSDATPAPPRSACVRRSWVLPTNMAKLPMLDTATPVSVTVMASGSSASVPAKEPPT